MPIDEPVPVQRAYAVGANGHVIGVIAHGMERQQPDTVRASQASSNLG